MSESWGRSARRAMLIAMWAFALLGTLVVGGYTWGRWRMLVSEASADLDPTPRDSDEFPNLHEDAAARVAQAKDSLRSFNRDYGLRFGLCVAFGGGLLAMPVLRRRRRRPPPPWEGEAANGRSWVLAAVLFAVLLLVVFLLVASNLRGIYPS
jgi:hypothetical protein